MPKKQQQFNYTSVNALPALPAIVTAWDLTKHFYRSEKAPRIETDLRSTEAAFEAFEKKFKGKDFTRTAKKLRAALEAHERLMVEANGATKVAYYLSYRRALDTRDAAAERLSHLVDQRLAIASNRLIFFELEIGRIPLKQQRTYLKDPHLQSYRYALERIFLEAAHTLTEPEEKILNLRSATSYSMWVDATEKIIGNRLLTWKRKQLSVPEALSQLDVLSSADKPRLWSKLLDAMEPVAEVVENELTAIVTHKKISDELRSYATPYAATIQNYENDEQSVLALVEAISTKGFALSRRFYALKARYHGRAALSYANKYDAIGTAAEIPFAQAVDVCRDTFYGVNREYGRIFDRMLTGGQIDVHPRAGKRGGAFMSSAVGLPTFVFLNHTNSFQSLETLAHEMGHAIHAERSKSQPARYQSFSTTTAETASTLFEQLVGNAILAQASPSDRLVMLHDRIGRDIATVQRQIAFFNFELEMHSTVRAQGAVTKEELQRMLFTHLNAYLGKGIATTLRDALGYVYIPHFRYGFYVYTYAYGLLMSMSMAKRHAADPSYATQIDTFLTAGNSDTVENIFSSIGIDAFQPATFLESLSSMERDIDEFERLISTKRRK